MELSETEQRLYGELFDRLEEKNGGSGKRITGVRAGELFLASGLPQETLHRITELCGAKRLGHFGRSQFYIALKLIAAAQAGFTVSIETIGPASGNDIPLPKFSSTAVVAAANKSPGAVVGNDPASTAPSASSAHFHHHHPPGASLDGAGAGFSPVPATVAGVSSGAPHLPPGAALMTASTTGVLPPPPNKGHMRSLSNQRMAHLAQAPVTDGVAGTASPASGVIAAPQPPVGVASGESSLTLSASMEETLRIIPLNSESAFYFLLRMDTRFSRGRSGAIFSGQTSHVAFGARQWAIGSRSSCRIARNRFGTSLHSF